MRCKIIKHPDMRILCSHRIKIHPQDAGLGNKASPAPQFAAFHPEIFSGGVSRIPGTLSPALRPPAIVAFENILSFMIGHCYVTAVTFHHVTARTAHNKVE